MTRKKQPPIVISTRRPEFAHLSDDAVTAAYASYEQRRREIYAALDNPNTRGPSDTDESLNEMLSNNEAHALALDDELCARDLPLPATKP